MTKVRLRSSKPSLLASGLKPVLEHQGQISSSPQNVNFLIISGKRPPYDGILLTRLAKPVEHFILKLGLPWGPSHLLQHFAKVVFRGAAAFVGGASGARTTPTTRMSGLVHTPYQYPYTVYTCICADLGLLVYLSGTLLSFLGLRPPFTRRFPLFNFSPRNVHEFRLRAYPWIPGSQDLLVVI